jgi:HD superfamily phosphohydrolase
MKYNNLFEENFEHQQYILIDNELLSELMSNKFYSDIVNSKAFKRLKKVSFLGAIDYLYTNKKKYSRYEHSLSVATLGLLYAKLTNISKEQRDYLVVSALLHDIGHGPLSHSMESVFKTKYHLSHHTNGNNIILGKTKSGVELNNILSTYGISSKKVVDILDGKIKEKYTFALYNPINIDTIDGILRSYLQMFSNKKRYEKIAMMLQPTDIVKAIVDKNTKVLDEFWKLKDFVYKNIIHKPINLYADIVSQKFASHQNICSDDFLLSDNTFRKKYHDLFVMLSSLENTYTRERLNYTKRFYIIKEDVKVQNNEDIQFKYVSKREKECINLTYNSSHIYRTLNMI